MKKLFFFLLFISLIYLAKPLWEEPASAYVDLSFLEPVDEKIATVLTKESLTNAVHTISETVDKAVLFFSSATDEEADVAEKVKKPNLEKPETSKFSVHNIEIGMSEQDVIRMLGNPNEQSQNEYNTKWNTYHQKYRNFMMVSYDDKRKVNALYTNDDLITSDSGVQYRSPKEKVREVFGEPLKEIRKGLNIFILQESEGFDLFETDNMYVYVFYDIHQNNTVTALQLVDKSLEMKKSGIYAGGNAQLQQGFERQLFDLTNAARVRHGLGALEWEPQVSMTARKHSRDMADHDYFSHENKQGKSPFDRMDDDLIKFKGAGENLAYGQSSSIFAHEGLMNSPGHRENILLDSYSHLGVGVAFNEKSQPYYTENFLLK